MSDTVNMNRKQLQFDKEITFLKAPKVLNVKNDDSALSTSKEQPKNKLTVEYEEVGSFQVFETICPLECFEITPLPRQKVSDKTRGTRHQVEKSKKSKKHDVRMKPSENLESDSEEEVSTLAEEPTRLITLDAFFRSENPELAYSAAGEVDVFWAKGDSSTVSSSIKVKDDDSNDSDLDPEIGKYIRSQKQKKKRGETLTGESLWYDHERSIIRNLHENGSISLTSYGDGDEKIFGKTKVFEAILTCEEKEMLKPKSPEIITIIKTEKKKRNVETKKNIKRANRPKDHGDWIG